MQQQTDGAWSGMMFAAEGSRAQLNLELKGQKGKVQIWVIGDETKEKSTGRVVELTSKRGEVRLVWSLDGEAWTQEITGHVQALERHAEAVIYGTFETRDAGEQVRDSGVLIAWRYAGRK